MVVAEGSVGIANESAVAGKYTSRLRMIVVLT
jgi:hypothetical protein